MKKKIILLILISLSLYLVNAEITNWTQFSLQSFIVNDGDEISFVTGASPDEEEMINDDSKFGIRWQYELSADLSKYIDINVSNDYFYSEKSHDLRNAFNYNYGQIKINYKAGNHYFRLQYANRFYNEDEIKITGLPGYDDIISQSMVHNTGLNYQFNASRFSLNLFTNMRNLDYVTYQDDNDEDDDLNWKHEFENDLYTWGKIGYDLSGNINIFIESYYKNDLNDEGWFDENDYGLGVEYHKRFDFFNILRAKFKYHIDDSQRLNENQRNQFYSELRYIKRIGVNWSGFLSYKNYSCYDKEEGAILRISNLVRLQVKYSYRLDDFKDSFFLAGIKLNPENNGTLYFGEWTHRVWSGLFINTGAKIAPELYTQYIGRLEYFFSGSKSVWLQTDMTDYEDYHSQNLISVGTTVIF